MFFLTYDPHRAHFTTSIIDDHKVRRSKRAAYIVARRRELKSHVLSDGSNVYSSLGCKTANHIIRQEAPRAPYKPTVEALRAHARTMWEAVEQGIPHGLPCGSDDAYGERLDYMRSHCLAIWREVGRF